MGYQPRFNYTEEIVIMLSKLEYHRGLVNTRVIPLHIAENLRYRAKLKSTHYSTAIEGNPLSIQKVEEVIKQRPCDSEDSHAQEVRNYWRAMSFLNKSKYMKVEVSEDFIKRLHRVIEVRGPGRRGKMSAYRGPTPPGILFCVRDSASGQIDYIPPAYDDVPQLMTDLMEWIKDEKSMPVPVKAAIVAYQLVTIHRFEPLILESTPLILLFS